MTKAIEEMMVEQGDGFFRKNINLAALECCTGIHRAKLCRMKDHDYEETKRYRKAGRLPQCS